MKKIISHALPIALAMTTVGCGVAYDGDELNSLGYEKTYTTADNMMPEPQLGGDKFDEFRDNPFVRVADEPTSTFSVDADGASYTIMRRYIQQGYAIDPSSVRIEEFLNYFTFDYASPTGDDAIAINAEVCDCPWTYGHLLLRLGIKGKELKENEMPLANYVFLIDVSGSMDSNDKLELLKSGLLELVDELNPDDRISIITYSGSVEKLIESTRVGGGNAIKIKKAIKKLSADGCTAGGQALQMAYEEALTNYDPQKNNRIIMGTDGDFNVGVTSTEALVEMVESYARKGIYMTCLGFGTGNLNDAMMEKISNAGNGSYYYIDSENEMMKVFVDERDRFVSVANDTKCQVTFNPDFVFEYRLIGYENRVMSNEDFENDKKDAGEIGAGQTITALYELAPADHNNSWMIDSRTNHHTIATFDVRYKKSLDAASIPLSTDIAIEDMYNNDITRKPLSANLNFAAGVAAYGMILRGSEYKGDATLQMATKLIQESLNVDPRTKHQEGDYKRRIELMALIKKYAEIIEKGRR